MHLVWGDCSGIIVEVEAYSAIGDEAAREMRESFKGGRPQANFQEALKKAAGLRQALMEKAIATFSKKVVYITDD